MNAPISTAALATIEGAPDRSTYIGGSDIASIIGISPWRTAAQTWLDKVNPEAKESRDTPATRRGTRLEPYIIDWASEEYSLSIVNRGQRYIDRDVPYFAAEVDAEVLVKGETGPIDNAEIKTVHPFGAKEWGEQQTDSLPVHYTAQVQWGMGITGRDRCHVIVLIGDDLRRYLVERDDEIIAGLRQRATEFWEQYVLPRIQPPLDYSHRTTLDTLRNLYPGTNGETIQASAMQEHWRAVFKDAARMARRYEAVQDAARAHLLSEMGENAAIDFGDGEVFRRRLVNKKAVTIVQPATSYMDARFAKAPKDTEASDAPA